MFGLAACLCFLADCQSRPTPGGAALPAAGAAAAAGAASTGPVPSSGRSGQQAHAGEGGAGLAPCQDRHCCRVGLAPAQAPGAAVLLLFRRLSQREPGSCDHEAASGLAGAQAAATRWASPASR